jgi:streptogrisin B
MHGIVGFSNEVTVELDEFNDAKIAEFKKFVMNSPAITFRKSPGKAQLEGLIQPGCLAATSFDESSYGTYTFRAKRNSDGVVGMVTAGHVIPVGGSVWTDGVYTGSCTQSHQGGSVDAAFIRVENTSITTPSNFLCGPTNDNLSTSTSRPVLGATVNMRGATTGYSSGTIAGEAITYTFDGNITYTNLTTANYSSNKGDSGGIIYTYFSSTNTRYSVGLHMAAVGTTRFFCKADLVLSTLGVSRY